MVGDKSGTREGKSQKRQQEARGNGRAVGGEDWAGATFKVASNPAPVAAPKMAAEPMPTRQVVMMGWSTCKTEVALRLPLPQPLPFPRHSPPARFNSSQHLLLFLCHSTSFHPPPVVFVSLSNSDSCPLPLTAQGMGGSMSSPPFLPLPAPSFQLGSRPQCQRA